MVQGQKAAMKIKPRHLSTMSQVSPTYPILAHWIRQRPMGTPVGQHFISWKVIDCLHQSCLYSKCLVFVNIICIHLIIPQSLELMNEWLWRHIYLIFRFVGTRYETRQQHVGGLHAKMRWQVIQPTKPYIIWLCSK